MCHPSTRLETAMSSS